MAVTQVTVTLDECERMVHTGVLRATWERLDLEETGTIRPPDAMKRSLDHWMNLLTAPARVAQGKLANPPTQPPGA